MDYKTILTATGIATAAAIGANKLAQPQPLVVQAAATTPAQTDDGCQVQRVHMSNWSPKHRQDTGPTYDVKVCGGKEVSRVEVKP